MIYALDITTPEKTPRTAPMETVITTGAPYINNIMVEFPPGCLGAVGIRFIHEGSQFSPRNLGGWITGNGERLKWPENFIMRADPYTIRIETYNEAIDWDHTLKVMIFLG